MQASIFSINTDKLDKGNTALRENIDFKGPLPTSNQNEYVLTICDEYSRFPFAFPCRDTSAKSVITHLRELFAVFGIPAYLHSDRGSAFMSHELKQFLHSKGIATSRTTSYSITLLETVKWKNSMARYGRQSPLLSKHINCQHQCLARRSSLCASLDSYAALYTNKQNPS